MKNKKPNIKTIIRKIVREEVAMAIGEVVNELKQPTESEPQPKKIVEKKSFTNNSVLNDVLNETAQDDGWKTLGGGEFTSDRMNELIGGQYGDMMNGTQQVPSSDPMSQFLNKDYSQVLEKSIEKSKNKLGR
jgi:hypothetical protein